MMVENSIKDIALAESGHKKIDWAAESMDILNQIKKDYSEQKPLKNKKIAICLHLEAKTAYMAIVLKQLGARVAICGSNPLSTQDDVAAALVEKGVEVHSWYGASQTEYHQNLEKVLKIKPDLIIDDGGDLVQLLHSADFIDIKKNVIGGAEETTTGINRLKALAREEKLEFPMMAVNDAFCKYLFDNRYGTGQSVWDGIIRTTNLVIAGKTVVVAGYGWCGKGVALRAKGLGARVIICEIDPVKACEAWMDGFQVMPMEEAAVKGDFFITVTGCKDVINKKHFLKMKDGAVLANAGHFDVEINKIDLKNISLSEKIVRQNIKQFQLENGRDLYLLAEGRLVNLAAADGHPVEIMDMSFSLQVLSLIYLIENPGMENRVHPVPEIIDKKVAFLKLEALGISIDELTEEQQQYLNKWNF